VHQRFLCAADAWLALAAAIVAAALDYAFGLDRSMSVSALRVAETFLATAFVLAAARGFGLARIASQPEAAPGTSKERPSPILPTVLEPWDDSKPAPVIMARLGQEVSACNPIIQTLCGHVQKAVANTEDLVVNTMHRLNKVDSTVTRMTGNLQKTSREKFLPLIEETERSLNSNKTTLLAFLAHTSDAAKESENRLASIAERVHVLEGTLQSMRKLAKHTSMLAVDSSVEYSKSGGNSCSFAVVSSEVKALAVQTEQAARNIGECLQLLKAAIEESVETLVVKHGLQERAEIARITYGMNDLERNMSEVIVMQRETLDTMWKESEEISQLVVDLLGSLQNQDIDRQRLNGVTQVLHQIVDHATSLASVMKSGNIDAAFVENMLAGIETKRQYALENSRIAHIERAAAPAIELF
jgi:methyl-accepting chemotaxis protein